MRQRPFVRSKTIRSKALLAAASAAILPLAFSQIQAAPNGARPAAGATAAEDGQWTMPSKDYASTRYSGLNQINRANVSHLKPVLTWDTGNRKGEEAPPLVVGSMMYLTMPYPNNIIAIDLAAKPRPAVKWVFRPNPRPMSQGVACCDFVNRGAVYSNGRLYFNTLDGQVIAIDANSGKQVWRTQVGNIMKGETITMSPLVAEGKVIVGDSGGEFGVRGWLMALDAASGKVAWKAFHSGPDKDVLIGPNFHPFYAADRGKDLGVHTWPPDAWKIGGGTAWGWVSYDPTMKMIFYGTGNPGPWNHEQRPGDNKWTTGVFARDIATGEARWFYQTTPHDTFDHDDINEQILLDMPVHGQMRQVMVRPSRAGYMYVIDRKTGQVYSAQPYSYINAYSGVDLKTGQIQIVKDKVPKEGRVIRNICPTASGAKDWNPSAFSPRTGLIYVPHENLCMDEGVMEANYIAGTPYLGSDVKMYAGPGGNRGELTAWDPVQAKPVWQIKEDLPLWSPALATAGDVVFYGTMDGWFKAIDATNGHLLWRFKTDSGIIGQPIAYRGPDGREYVAVMSGVGGWAGAIIAGPLDPHDPSAALGFVNAVRDLPKRTQAGGRLYVFALPR